MLSISQQFSTLDQWLEDPLSHRQQENKETNFLNNKETILTQTAGSNTDQYLHDSSSYGIVEGKRSEFPSYINQGDEGENKMMKKINHNASERDRRKRINSLYSALRSLLPAEDLCRKLSIPATVSRVVQYIPELRREVEGLLQKKETLMLNISREDEDNSMEFRAQLEQKRKAIQSSLSAISAAQISDQEMIVQISMPQFEKGSFCGALTHLEMEGFLVISATWFESFGGRVFGNLHLQAHGSQVKDADMLKERISSFFEEREGI